MQPSLDLTLSALADPSRRHVVELLMGGPRRAGEIASASGMSPPAMSRHLRVLLSSGLIEAERPERDARLRIFRLSRGPFDELGQWLAEVEAFWSRQIDSLRAYVEGGAVGTPGSAGEETAPREGAPGGKARRGGGVRRAGEARRGPRPGSGGRRRKR